jgi:hypothetical protein
MSQQFWILASLLLTSAVVLPDDTVATQPVKAYEPAAPAGQSRSSPVQAPAAKPAMKPVPAPAPRSARGSVGSIAFLALCACVGISTLLTFQVTQLFLRPVATASHLASTPTQIPKASPTPNVSGQVTLGPWKGQVGRLELTVDKVELVSQIGDKKILRFYLTVNNQSGDTLRLPLFGNFLAIDSNGQTYQADSQISQWPESIPAGLVVTGSIDLVDPVPQAVSDMKIHFATIFGAVEFVGKSVTVSDIEVP